MNYKEELEKLLLSLKNAGIDRRTIEDELGYTRHYLDQQVSKGGNKRLHGALTNYAAQKGILQKEIQEAIPQQKRVAASAEIQPRREPSAMDKLLHIHDVLAKANAEAITKIGVAIDTNKTLVDTNKMLADRVLATSSVSAEQQRIEAFDTRLKNLLVSLADVASGKHFQSKKEALASIHKAVYGVAKESALDRNCWLLSAKMWTCKISRSNS